MMRLYCFQPHFRAIATSWLQPLGFPQSEIVKMLFPVTRSQEMAGHEPGTATFIYIENHQERVPTALMHMARAYGLLEIALSDQWTRERREPIGYARGGI